MGLAASVARQRAEVEPRMPLLGVNYPSPRPRYVDAQNWESRRLFAYAWAPTPSPNKTAAGDADAAADADLRDFVHLWNASTAEGAHDTILRWMLAEPGDSALAQLTRARAVVLAATWSWHGGASLAETKSETKDGVRATLSVVEPTVLGRLIGISTLWPSAFAAAISENAPVAGVAVTPWFSELRTRVRAAYSTAEQAQAAIDATIASPATATLHAAAMAECSHLVNGARETYCVWPLWCWTSQMFWRGVAGIVEHSATGDLAAFFDPLFRAYSDQRDGYGFAAKGWGRDEVRTALTAPSGLGAGLWNSVSTTLNSAHASGDASVIADDPGLVFGHMYPDDRSRYQDRLSAMARVLATHLAVRWTSAAIASAWFEGFHERDLQLLDPELAFCDEQPPGRLRDLRTRWPLHPDFPHQAPLWSGLHAARKESAAAQAAWAWLAPARHEPPPDASQIDAEHAWTERYERAWGAGIGFLPALGSPLDVASEARARAAQRPWRPLLAGFVRRGDETVGIADEGVLRATVETKALSRLPDVALSNDLEALLAESFVDPRMAGAAARAVLRQARLRNLVSSATFACAMTSELADLSPNALEGELRTLRDLWRDDGVVTFWQTLIALAIWRSASDETRGLLADVALSRIKRLESGAEQRVFLKTIEEVATELVLLDRAGLQQVLESAEDDDRSMPCVTWLQRWPLATEIAVVAVATPDRSGSRVWFVRDVAEWVTAKENTLLQLEPVFGAQGTRYIQHDLGAKAAEAARLVALARWRRLASEAKDAADAERAARQAFEAARFARFAKDRKDERAESRLAKERAEAEAAAVAARDLAERKRVAEAAARLAADRALQLKAEADKKRADEAAVEARRLEREARESRSAAEAEAKRREREAAQADAAAAAEAVRRAADRVAQDAQAENDRRARALADEHRRVIEEERKLLVEERRLIAEQGRARDERATLDVEMRTADRQLLDATRRRRDVEGQLERARQELAELERVVNSLSRRL